MRGAGRAVAVLCLGAGLVPMACGMVEAPNAVTEPDASTAADAANALEPAADAGGFVPNEASSDVAADGTTFVCPPPSAPAPTPAFVGGTRIRPVYLTSQDGLDFRYAIRDTELGLDCHVQWGVDGVARCVPDGPGATALLYADDTCTSRAIASYQSLPAKVVAYERTSGCGRDPALVTLGTEIASTYARNEAGACVPFPWGEHAFAATVQGKEAFVKLTRAAVPLTPSIDTFVYDGEDGSRVVGNEVVDRVHRVPLLAQRDPLGVDRWLPPQRFPDLKSLPKAADASATEYCEGPNDFFVDRPSCPWDVKDASIGYTDGAIYEPIPGFVQTAYRCGVSESWLITPYDASAPGYRAGPPVLPLCAMERAPYMDLGGTRLRARVRTLAGAQLHGSRHALDITDLVTGENCDPYVADDGVLRCMPSSTNRIAFTDDLCTQPIAVDSGGLPKKYASERNVNAVDPCSTTVYSFTGWAAGVPKPAQTWHHARSNGTCVCVKDTTPESKVFEITGTVPASSFASVELTVR